VSELIADERLSIGDYVLTGGELPALVVTDAVARLLPACWRRGRRRARVVRGGAAWSRRSTRGRGVSGRPGAGGAAVRRPARVARWRREQALWLDVAAAPRAPRGGESDDEERRLIERFERGEAPAAPTRTERTKVMDAIRIVEAAQLKKDRQGFEPGDQVRVHVKVIEGEKERTQIFDGTVIRSAETARAPRSPSAASPTRRVERTFPLHSPRIDRIEVVRRARVRRSKLYYLRSLAGKAARLREKRINVVPATAPESQTE